MNYVKEQPAQRLDAELRDAFGPRPFTYADVERRYADTFDNLPQVFASVMRNHDYFHGVLDNDPFISRGYSGDHVDALVELRDYLDAEDEWFLTRSFHSKNSDIARYIDNIPKLTDKALKELYEEGLVSHHGGMDIITDEGWWAIYLATAEPVYLPRTTDKSDDETLASIVFEA